MAFILALIVVGIALVIIGVVVHGLFNLLFVGVVVLVLMLLYSWLRNRRRQRR
jgi:Flp pilus assembly protein TadB